MRRTAWAVALATLAAALAACHTTHVVWSKPGADQSALRSDLQACAAQANAGKPLSADIRTMTNAADETSPGQVNWDEASRQQVGCMLSRGWKLTPLPSS